MNVFYLLFGFNLFVLVSFLGEAKINGAATSESDDKVYIVYMGKTRSLDGSLRNDHVQLMDELRIRKKSVLHKYNKSFLGFTARLSDEEAESIAQRDGVVSVFPDKKSQLHTTRSWDFLMTQTPPFIINGSTIPHSVSNWSKGADTIIGIIDTGIWPEHPNFNDKCMDPIPSRWNGTCMPGQNSTNPLKCNRKVIGARYYDDPEEPGSITTARDHEGHGTHTSSTAAGKLVWGASYKGLAKGIARGGSPTSRIATYCVCGPDVGCPSSGVLKAFDDAIADGVDVLSVSIGSLREIHNNFFINAIAIGAFHAVEKGITVVCSAGNRGPSPRTASNVAPWILTVGATTIDRKFETVILLGRNKIIKGAGINFSVLNKSAVYPLVDGRSAGSNLYNASNCIPGSLDGAKVKGKIVVCEYNDKTGLDDKIDGLMKQGAVGIIMINEFLNLLPFDYETTPFASIGEEDGVQVRSYISSTRNPLATIHPTTVVLNQKPAPIVADFSSRGPTPGIKDLLKPDVAAPGVGIIAARPPVIEEYTSAETIEPPPLFDILSGTSLACPHVSGLAATVKSQHPTWSPSAIRSAIMTTAIPTDNLYARIKTSTGSRATPYDIGAGEINLLGPLYPGLIYETKNADYVQFLCNMGYNASVIKSISSTVPSNFDCPSNSSPDLISDMNYPSIAISDLEENKSRTVTRTVTNVGEVYSTYTATVEAPAGMHVQVVPNILRFSKTVTKLSFVVKFTLTTTSKEPLFGSVILSSGYYKVQSPFAVSNE
ncbi:hypothetical protein CASFOL_015972 [Castilleja foliolosa]|uniref:Subtilisin-like protease n=1 Tax=Castilleja foliolosa TaxID=1961234 RepID=A0ABD3DJ00_9LAMI